MATDGDCGSLGVGARVTVPVMLSGVAAGGGANIIQETPASMCTGKHDTGTGNTLYDSNGVMSKCGGCGVQRLGLWRLVTNRFRRYHCDYTLDVIYPKRWGHHTSGSNTAKR